MVTKRAVRKPSALQCYWVCTTSLRFFFFFCSVGDNPVDSQGFLLALHLGITLDRLGETYRTARIEPGSATCKKNSLCTNSLSPHTVSGHCAFSWDICCLSWAWWNDVTICRVLISFICSLGDRDGMMLIWKVVFIMECGGSGPIQAMQYWLFSGQSL